MIYDKEYLTEKYVIFTEYKLNRKNNYNKMECYQMDRHSM